MKTIIYIITKSEVGGAQTWVRDQTKLFKDDFKQIIITNNEGWLSVHNYAEKVYFVKEIESKFSIFALFKILKIFIKEQANTVISSSANAGLYARLSKIFYKHRSIYVSHGWSCIYNGGKFKSVFIKVEKLLSHLTDTILCVSDKDAHNAINIVNINPKKIKVIRNSVFPQQVRKSKDINYLNILTVGRLSHPKRFDLLIDAVKDIEGITLTIVGGGPDRGKYDEVSNVKFLGEVKNFSNFHMYDLFTLISDSEGLPMSAIEAASAGLPLLLSDVGGCSELIDENGFIVKNNKVDIINKIELIKSDYSYYNNNAIAIKDSFNIKMNKDKYYTLYSNVYFFYYNLVFFRFLI
ncbi:glycosyltransferase [Photobacterium angustum]|uniref:glycosyltransferase n=3 Tax=Photobacterium angustum TaxID=661 RepID=UPI0005EB335D|nr:glycosyltransferase [Photobacterium angustum]